jgi:hypothetical protein
MPRDYKKDYKDYQGLAKSIKQRASRNQARKIMVEKYGVKACKNKDVDHKDHNPLNNKISNLRLRSISNNRADNKHKSK